MKKFLSALLALPLLALITACSDSDKPNVNINLTYGANNVESNGKVYVVAGNDFTIESVQVQAVDQSKKASLGPVTYYLIPNTGTTTVPLLIGTTPVEPFALKMPTAAAESPATTDNTDGSDSSDGTVTKQYLTGQVPLTVGEYLIQMVMPIYEVDCELATGYVTIDVVVVASESDMPQPSTTPQEPVTPTYK